MTSVVNILYLWTGYDTKHRKISVEEHDGALAVVVDGTAIYFEGQSMAGVVSDPPSVPLTVEFVDHALAAAYRRRARFVQNLATFGKVSAGDIHKNEQDIAALHALKNNPNALNGEGPSTGTGGPVYPVHEHTDIRVGGPCS